MPELSLSAVVDDLTEQGWTAEFAAADGMLVCGPCGNRVHPRDVQIDRVYRFEGSSDPDDEAVVFALTCGDCGARGQYVVGYGPSMSGADADVVSHLSRRHQG
jgi:hypothetical protein